MELLGALSIIGVLAVVMIPRVALHDSAGKAAACHANQGEIEVQVQLWKRENGSLPATALGDIGIDLDYFPEGLPTCPVDGSSYTIDTSTGRVLGHDH